MSTYCSCNNDCLARLVDLWSRGVDGSIRIVVPSGCRCWKWGLHDGASFMAGVRSIMAALVEGGTRRFQLSGDLRADDEQNGLQGSIVEKGTGYITNSAVGGILVATTPLAAACHGKEYHQTECDRIRTY
jgi:hypothetical protein